MSDGRVPKRKTNTVWSGPNGGESCILTLSTFARIKSESEPPNLPTEINAWRFAIDVTKPASPVRFRGATFANTPRNRGVFSGRARVRTRSLCI